MRMTLAERIMRYLRRVKKPKTARQIAERIGEDAQTVSARLHTLRVKGFVEATKLPKGPGTHFAYRVTR